MEIYKIELDALFTYPVFGPQVANTLQAKIFEIPEYI